MPHWKVGLRSMGRSPLFAGVAVAVVVGLADLLTGRLTLLPLLLGVEIGLVAWLIRYLDRRLQGKASRTAAEAIIAAGTYTLLMLTTYVSLGRPLSWSRVVPHGFVALFLTAGVVLLDDRDHLASFRPIDLEQKSPPQ